MKKTLMIAAMLVTIAFFETKAQILTPVHWSYAAKKIGKDEAVVFLKATIDEGWHLYSQTVKDGGPVKTTISFPPSTTYTLIGNTAEPKPISRFEKAFNMDVSFFEHEAIFQQKVKLKTGQVTVKGTLLFMTCNDRQCLPPVDQDFSVAVK